ncbi:antibiotic biosynthesis monooxygenase family protein [Kitasatospora sp. NPDC094011]|uniref:antibiotic biosynthesis monooxygenase family protein n=1 Tax=Kitasatospora sp. NPDC094011 TaxID=3364090 RepID=UPI0038035569
MSFGFVAFHYPAPEHLDGFVGNCHRIADYLRAQPGFESVGVWVSSDGSAVVTNASFASEEAFQASADGAHRMGATPDGISDLEIRPREVTFLVSR